MKLSAALSLLFAAALIAGCGQQRTTDSRPAAALPPVKARLAAVHAEPVPFLTDVTGTVRPLEHAQIAAKVMGVIEELPITLGQRVRRGDILARIGAGEINARLVQAQSQLNAARRDLERERDLLTKGASTADMVRGLEDRFTAAQATVREAEVMLGYATLRAPFDGVIARKLANAGDLASPGYPLLEIEGTTGFEVEAGIPDSLASALVIGTPIAVEIPAAGLSVTGKVSEYSSSADVTARTISAKIALPAHDGIRSGQFARLQLPGASVKTLLVPESAVSATGQMERVFIASNDNRAVLRLVKTGARQGDQVEILAGIDDGERIVVAPPVTLREGQALEILP
jgi:membrane fusion protein, multidrug efflux system